MRSLVFFDPQLRCPRRRESTAPRETVSRLVSCGARVTLRVDKSQRTLPSRPFGQRARLHRQAPPFAVGDDDGLIP